jgi:hypothetical protein
MNDGDSEDGNKVTDNIVGVKLNTGENDTGNDFVDSDNSKISGTVKDDHGTQLSVVLLTRRVLLCGQRQRAATVCMSSATKSLATTPWSRPTLGNTLPTCLINISPMI